MRACAAPGFICSTSYTRNSYAPQTIPRALQALLDGPPNYAAQQSMLHLIPHLTSEHETPTRAVMRHMLSSRSDISPLRRALAQQLPEHGWWGDFAD